MAALSWGHVDPCVHQVGDHAFLEAGDLSYQDQMVVVLLEVVLSILGVVVSSLEVGQVGPDSVTLEEVACHGDQALEDHLGHQNGEVALPLEVVLGVVASLVLEVVLHPFQVVHPWEVLLGVASGVGAFHQAWVEAVLMEALVGAS